MLCDITSINIDNLSEDDKKKVNKILFIQLSYLRPLSRSIIKRELKYAQYILSLKPNSYIDNNFSHIQQNSSNSWIISTDSKRYYNDFLCHCALKHGEIYNDEYISSFYRSFRDFVKCVCHNSCCEIIIQFIEKLQDKFNLILYNKICVELLEDIRGFNKEGFESLRIGNF